MEDQKRERERKATTIKLNDAARAKLEAAAEQRRKVRAYSKEAIVLEDFIQDPERSQATTSQPAKNKDEESHSRWC